jgi:hypothetical protein
MRVEAQLHTRATRSHLGPRTLNLDRNIDPKHFPPPTWDQIPPLIVPRSRSFSVAHHE